MTPRRRIARSAAFAIGSTLVSMKLVSLVSGIDIPPVFWAVGFLCPAVLGTMTSARQIHQSEQIRRLYAELQHSHAMMKVAAQTDPLTGVLNRGAFLARIAELRAAGQIGWLVLLDVDHFKHINDRHGHETGDDALLGIAGLIREAVRADDLIGRLGGEEFGIYLPQIGADDALALTERVRAHLAQSPAYAVNGEAYCVTASLGMAIEQSPGETLKDIIHRADMAMYRAKDEGRNRIAAVV